MTQFQENALTGKRKDRPCFIGSSQLPPRMQLDIQMFKVYSTENTQIKNEFFCIKDKASYELRQRSCFRIP